ncbi:hypothetical protein [Acidithiobacillus thiooxidans]|uniref:hypothetical protein n=1 Tax=Acidithiobacillus thiooxidans TaxID=930 RepID=UPI0035659093
MCIELVSVDAPLERMTQIVRNLANELQWEARWNGETFVVHPPRAEANTDAESVEKDFSDAGI